MGSSKKHKDKDSKKKRKHRSRSRSRDRDRKRRHAERSPEAEDPSAMLERYYTDGRDSRTHGHDGEHEQRSRKERTKKESPPPSEAKSAGEGLSLSIEETNRLRAKLGLKPLDVSDKPGADGKTKLSEVHAPAANMSEKLKTDKLREKMSRKKSQRGIEAKLRKVKGLGDSDSEDEDARAWVLKSRKIQQDKEMAEKRAKLLEEMDEDFGVGSLVDQEFKKGKTKEYTSQDLSGLTVEHTLDKFSEGRNVILTLKDKGVLDEEDDVLVNVNIEDDERAEKNVEVKKKRPDYKPYDEPQLDEYGMMKPSNLLSKYDEEIDGVKKDSFTLDNRGVYDAAHEKRMAEIRQQLKAQRQTLTLDAPILASEFLTKEEVEASKFKKIRKKVRKIRKKEILKADDILPLADDNTSQDYGSRNRGKGRNEMKLELEEDMEEGEVQAEDKPEDIPEIKPDLDTAAFHTGIINPKPILPDINEVSSVKINLDDDDFMGPDEDLSGVAVEEEMAQNELQAVLARARKLKLKKEKREFPSALEETEIKEEPEGSNIILNSISEFCRNLGDIPTYGLAGNREEDRDELMDTELELLEQQRQQEETEEQIGGWNEVDIDENPVDIQDEDAVVLEEEPIASDGIGAALKLAMRKGYLEDEQPLRHNTMSAKAIEELQSKNYTIQDKRYDDLDEKNRKRDRYVGGMTTEFKEKSLYKPVVKLDYVDEGGRSLSQKEAFRQLSHRFHGKGSGKKKTEKRGKKVEEELLMKHMSSIDTPLNTLSLLKDKQKLEKSPYIMLSGNKSLSSNSIMKSQ